MTTNYPNSESNDLYTREFLVRVPIAFLQDSQTRNDKQPSIVVSFVVSCISMVGMIIYQQATIRTLGWDFRLVILVLLTGVVSFALTSIFKTLIFGEK